MFTGIIEGLGTIKAVLSKGKGSVFTIDSDFVLDNTKIGDSIAVNGACLTVVEIQEKKFKVDVAPETLTVTHLGNIEIGERVNLERALKLSDRIDGHLVSGHVDGVGTISKKKNLGNAIIVTIDVSEAILNYMIKKGSVAIDGISLTINKCGTKNFEISIIPHTSKLTTIGFKDVGARVNIETDMIGKYVERIMTRKKENGEESGVDMEFLAKTGFL